MRYILILLWLLLGVGYCSISNICGSDHPDKLAPNIVASESETPCPTLGPYYFEWSSADLKVTKQWNNYKSSLLEKMEETSKIRIKGLYHNKEENQSEYGNLGMARAEALSKFMGLDESKFQLESDSLINVKYNFDCKIPGANIRLVTVSEKIKEIDDKILIYFPVNSVNKLADVEVEEYLDKLAIRVIEKSEKLKIDGHTDNSGSREYNLELANMRVQIIKDYLLSRGVKPHQIITESFGDQKPIQTNETDKGRAANRRVELKILEQ